MTRDFLAGEMASVAHGRRAGDQRLLVPTPTPASNRLRFRLEEERDYLAAESLAHTIQVRGQLPEGLTTELALVEGAVLLSAGLLATTDGIIGQLLVASPPQPGWQYHWWLAAACFIAGQGRNPQVQAHLAEALGGQVPAAWAMQALDAIDGWDLADNLLQSRDGLYRTISSWDANPTQLEQTPFSERLAYALALVRDEREMPYRMFQEFIAHAAADEMAEFLPFVVIDPAAPEHRRVTALLGLLRTLRQRPESARLVRWLLRHGQTPSWARTFIWQGLLLVHAQEPDIIAAYLREGGLRPAEGVNALAMLSKTVFRPGVDFGEILLALLRTPGLDDWFVDELLRPLAKFASASAATLQGLLELARNEQISDQVRGQVAQTLLGLMPAVPGLTQQLLALLEDEQIVGWWRLRVAIAFIKPNGPVAPQVDTLVQTMLNGDRASWQSSAAINAYFAEGVVAEALFADLAEVIRDEQTGYALAWWIAKQLATLAVTNPPALETLLALVIDRALPNWKHHYLALTFNTFTPEAMLPHLDTLLTIVQDRRANHYSRLMAAYHLGRLTTATPRVFALCRAALHGGDAGDWLPTWSFFLLLANKRSNPQLVDDTLAILHGADSDPMLRFLTLSLLWTDREQATVMRTHLLAVMRDERESAWLRLAIIASIWANVGERDLRNPRWWHKVLPTGLSGSRGEAAWFVGQLQQIIGDRQLSGWVRSEVAAQLGLVARRDERLFKWLREAAMGTHGDIDFDVLSAAIDAMAIPLDQPDIIG